MATQRANEPGNYNEDVDTLPAFALGARATYHRCESLKLINKRIPLGRRAKVCRDESNDQHIASKYAPVSRQVLFLLNMLTYQQSDTSRPERDWMMAGRLDHWSDRCDDAWRCPMGTSKSLGDVL